MSYVDTINENKTYQQKIDRILITALRHDCQIFLAITKNLTKTATFIPWTAQKTHSRSVSQVSGRQHLRSASRRKLNISRFHRSTWGTRAFPVPRLGVHFLIRCVIRPSSLNALGGTWKRISLPTLRHGRIKGVTVSQNRAIQIDINLLTYLHQHHMLQPLKQQNPRHFVTNDIGHTAI